MRIAAKHSNGDARLGEFTIVWLRPLRLGARPAGINAAPLQAEAKGWRRSQFWSVATVRVCSLALTVRQEQASVPAHRHKRAVSDSESGLGSRPHWFESRILTV